jgi:hypothetical protein
MKQVWLYLPLIQILSLIISHHYCCVYITETLTICGFIHFSIAYRSSRISIRAGGKCVLYFEGIKLKTCWMVTISPLINISVNYNNMVLLSREILWQGNEYLTVSCILTFLLVC